MTQTATLMPFITLDNTCRLNRILGLRVRGALDSMTEELDKGLGTTLQGDVFMIEFDTALEIEGRSVSDVERMIRAWLKEHYEDDIELVCYESPVRSRQCSVQLRVK